MIEWTPTLATGVNVLDEQHKAIFQWLAELESASADQRTLFGVYVITRLKHYMREHFATEETMMEAAGYPNLEQHKAEHATFRAKLQELQLRSISEDISADTVDFLRHWLTNHIAKTDMAYVPYLKKWAARSRIACIAPPPLRRPPSRIDRAAHGARLPAWPSPWLP